MFNALCFKAMCWIKPCVLSIKARCACWLRVLAAEKLLISLHYVSTVRAARSSKAFSSTYLVAIATTVPILDTIFSISCYCVTHTIEKKCVFSVLCCKCDCIAPTCRTDQWKRQQVEPTTHNTLDSRPNTWGLETRLPWSTSHFRYEEIAGTLRFRW